MSNETTPILDKTKYHVQNDYVSFNANDKPLFFNCENKTTWFTYYPDYKLNSRDCGNYSMYTITYWLRLSETWNTKHICDLCLNHLIERYGIENFIFSE